MLILHILYIEYTVYLFFLELVFSLSVVMEEHEREPEPIHTNPSIKNRYIHTYITVWAKTDQRELIILQSNSSQHMRRLA